MHDWTLRWLVAAAIARTIGTGECTTVAKRCSRKTLFAFDWPPPFNSERMFEFLLADSTVQRGTKGVRAVFASHVLQLANCSCCRRCCCFDGTGNCRQCNIIVVLLTNERTEYLPRAMYLLLLLLLPPLLRCNAAVRVGLGCCWSFYRRLR